VGFVHFCWLLCWEVTHLKEMRQTEWSVYDTENYWSCIQSFKVLFDATEGPELPSINFVWTGICSYRAGCATCTTNGRSTQLERTCM
jgi:hypothetical protein